MSMPDDIRPQRLRAEIKRRGLRQADIADAIGCDQGQVSRLLNRQTPSRSKTYRHICQFILAEPSRQRALDERLLHDALNDCWDGSSESAQAIAGVLRALAGFKPTRGEPR